MFLWSRNSIFAETTFARLLLDRVMFYLIWRENVLTRNRKLKKENKEKRRMQIAIVKKIPMLWKTMRITIRGRGVGKKRYAEKMKKTIGKILRMKSTLFTGS